MLAPCRRTLLLCPIPRAGSRDHEPARAPAGRRRLARRDRTVDLQLLGRIAAGAPLFHSDHVEGARTVAADRLGPRAASCCYLLRVQGDSMTGDGIRDGDLIVVRHQEHAEFGDIVVAALEHEGATVKRLEQRDGRVDVVASNPDYPPIEVPNPEDSPSGG